MKTELIILALLSSSFANFYCYQSSANILNQSGLDNSCEQIYNGSYNFNATSYSSHRYLDMTVTYIKPLLATDDSIFTFAMGVPEFTYQNTTIPTDCWLNNDTSLTFKFSSEAYYFPIEGQPAIQGGSKLFCANETEWIELSSNYGYAQIRYGPIPGIPTYNIGMNWHNGNVYDGSTGVTAPRRLGGNTIGDFPIDQGGYSYVYDSGIFWDISDSFQLKESESLYCS